MSAAAPASVLPSGWLPEGEVVDVYLRRKGRTWVAEAKQFPITTAGETPDAAVDNALRDLYDYLSREAQSGRSYGDARGTKSSGRLEALVVLLLLLIRSSDREVLRVPLRVVEEREALRETVEILQDDGALDDLRASAEDIVANRLIPLEDVRRELGLA